MHRVLLADDEEIIREGLRTTVPWEMLGLELVAVAEDGVDALEMSRLHRPDIVITDIRMPRMDGLDLIRALRQQLPDCALLILTGHGEFDYARTALQLGVSDYLLKPVVLIALCDVLSRLRRELDARHSWRAELEQLQQQVQEERILRQQRLLRRYIAGQANAEELERGLPSRLTGAPFCAGVLVQIDDFDRLTSDMDEETIFFFTQELEQVLVAQCGDGMRIVENDNGRYFLVFTGETAEEVRFGMRSYVRKLRAAVASTAHTTIASSIVQGGMARCRQAYDETCRCLDQVFLLGSGQDIQAGEALQRDLISPLPEGIDMRGIIRSLSGFNKAEIRATLDNVADGIRKTTHNTYLYTSMLVSFVYGEMIRMLSEMHCPVQTIFPDPMAEFQKLMACQTLDGMMEELERILSAVCGFLERNANANQDAVERAKVYIDEHYGDSRLCLNLVAATVGVSPTYLSALFKQNAGQSFVRYLTETRLGHAQRLLRSGDYLSYEVGYMCGYENSTYFSTIFKRYTGVSPTEYRKLDMENQ